MTPEQQADELVHGWLAAVATTLDEYRQGQATDLAQYAKPKFEGVWRKYQDALIEDSLLRGIEREFQAISDVAYNCGKIPERVTCEVGLNEGKITRPDLIFIQWRGR